jgi:hypothetical protein
MDQTELISEIDRWQDEGRALRERLVAERETLAKRLNELDKRLAMIPTEIPMGKKPETHHNPEQGVAPPTSKHIYARDNLTEVVRKLIQSAVQPLPAGEVVSLVLAVRPKAKKTHIHGSLFQLKKRKELMAIGEPGSLRYQWNGTNKHDA